MPATKPSDRETLPGRFDALVALLPPQAITDDVHYENMLEMIDRLMTNSIKGMAKLSKGGNLRSWGNHFLLTFTQSLFCRGSHGVSASLQV